jgi:hypothetical protein
MVAGTKMAAPKARTVEVNLIFGVASGKALTGRGKTRVEVREDRRDRIPRLSWAGVSVVDNLKVCHWELPCWEHDRINSWWPVYR